MKGDRQQQAKVWQRFKEKTQNIKKLNVGSIKWAANSHVTGCFCVMKLTQ